MLRYVLALCVCLLAQSAAAADWGRIRADEAALYVQDLHSGEVLLEHRADVAVNPASTMKLVTAFAALRGLGEDYRWLTQWQSDGGIRGDTLDGNLYWRGSGNPVLDQNDLLDMQQQLVEQGIRHIGGRLVLDGSVWQGNGSADDFDDDAGKTFATAPDPHMLAYKVVWLRLERDDAGVAQLTLNPPLPDVRTDSTWRSVAAGSCVSLKTHLQADYRDGVLSLHGDVPEDCAGQEMFVNMLDAPDFAARSFINHWRMRGGSIGGGTHSGRTPSRAVVLAANQSKPFAEVLADMNKQSNNIIARSIFLALGAESGKGGNTPAAAKAAVRRQLAQSGIDTEALVLENGSGLSRRERVTARMMGALLQRAYRSPFQTAFIDSLPVAGQDGTLKNRFRGSSGALRLKTGSLKNVRALAGYWLPADGQQHPLAVVLIVNSEQAAARVADMDKLLISVLHDFGRNE